MKETLFNVAVLVIWSIVGAALVMLFKVFFEIFWLGTALIYLIFALAGVVAMASIVACSVSGRHFLSGIVVMGFPLVGGALWFMSPTLQDFGTTQIRSYRFNRDLPKYEEIIRDLDVESESFVMKDEISFRIDNGPPLRIAFVQPGGLLDNWEGVVFDPTGEVLKAQGWVENSGRQAFSAPDHIVRLFGGDIVSCKPIQGHYYRCWFT